MTWFGTTDLAPADCRLIRFTALRRTFYLASMAVTSLMLVANALANKMARTAWAMLVKQENYRVPVMMAA